MAFLIYGFKFGVDRVWAYNDKICIWVSYYKGGAYSLPIIFFRLIFLIRIYLFSFSSRTILSFTSQFYCSAY